MNINEIIKYPILTEKTYQQMETHVYTFAVDKRATKTEIKKAIQFIFEVQIVKVNLFNVPKKAKKVGKYNGFSKSFKKAIVTLSKSSASINIFPEEGIAKDEVLKKPKKDLEKLKTISATEQRVAEKISKSKKPKKDLETPKLVSEIEKKDLETPKLVSEIEKKHQKKNSKEINKK